VRHSSLEGAWCGDVLMMCPGATFLDTKVKGGRWNSQLDQQLGSA
jgi:hypothetical protein